MSRVLIKICGIQFLKEAQAAIKGGADFIGFQFIPLAKRRITARQALAIIKKLPPNVSSVGVFVNEGPEIINKVASQCKLSYVQLQGEESPQYCQLIKFPIIKAFEVKDKLDLSIFKPYERAVDKFLLDTPHDFSRQSGETFDFEIAVEACRKYQIMIAGGLSAKNVTSAIKLLQPWGMDVSGGVRENERISLKKVKEFVKVVRKS